MNVGDTVQIRQTENFAEAPKADPPIAAGKVDFWVYATVLAITGGNVQVRVQHQGNRQHGQVFTVPAADVRDKAAVLALRDAVQSPSAQYKKQLQTHYQVQADHLT